MEEILKKLIKNSINIKMIDKIIKLGDSKFGGKPHLPKDFVWPYFTGTNFDNETKSRPLAFLAQINLQDAKKFDKDNVLPSEGMLYFFYEMCTMTWGFDPNDKDATKVFYVKDKELFETDFPSDLDEKYIVPEKAIDFECEKSLPAFEEYSETIDCDADWDEYDEQVALFGVDPAVEPDQCFKLLGYANIIQNSILEECEAVSRGIDCGEPLDLPKKVQKDINEKSKDWILLAQFGTISEELMFGDCGCLYIYIRKQDLKNLDFSKIHFSLQCG